MIGSNKNPLNQTCRLVCKSLSKVDQKFWLKFYSFFNSDGAFVDFMIFVQLYLKKIEKYLLFLPSCLYKNT